MRAFPSAARRLGLCLWCAWMVGALGAVQAVADDAVAVPSAVEALTVAMQAEPARICPGWNPHYLVWLTNSGDKPLTHVVVTDHLPIGTCCATDGLQSQLPGAYDATGNVMVWEIARLDPGQSLRLHVVLHSYRTLPHGAQLQNRVSCQVYGQTGQITAPAVTVDRNLCPEVAQSWPTLTPTPRPAPTRTVLPPVYPLGLRFDPPTAEIAFGETELVTLYVENARGLYGIQVAIGFDPRIVRIADADPATPGVQVAPGVAPQPDLVAINQVDHDLGMVQYAAAQLGEGQPFAGHGAVLTLGLVGVGGGTTRLSLTEHLLASPEGLPIAHFAEDAEVVVVPIPEPPRTPLAPASRPAR